MCLIEHVLECIFVLNFFHGFSQECGFESRKIKLCAKDPGVDFDLPSL
jgi:hypothetical protein